MSKPKPDADVAETIPASFVRLMAKKGSLAKALNCLHRNLDAKKSHYDVAKGEWVAEDDAPSQVASAKALLSYAIGEPVKRQQILSGKMPEATPSRAQLKDTIDRRIAALLDRPDLSVSELLAARKAVAEAEANEPAAQMTEEEYVAAARKIHGMDLTPEELSLSAEPTK